MRQPQRAVTLKFQLRITLISPQRIATGRHVIDGLVELLARQLAIGPGGGDFREQFIRMERPRAGPAQYVLRQHVHFQDHRILGVLRIHLRRLQCGLALQHLEAVGRDEQRLRRQVQLVVRAADPLQQPARPLGCAHMHHEVHVAPVDAEFERRGADHGAQPAFAHRRLHLAPLAHIQRAMVKRDRQIVVIRLPQRLEHQFGL